MVQAAQPAGPGQQFRPRVPDRTVHVQGVQPVEPPGPDEDAELLGVECVIVGVGPGRRAGHRRRGRRPDPRGDERLVHRPPAPVDLHPGDPAALAVGRAGQREQSRLVQVGRREVELAGEPQHGQQVGGEAAVGLDADGLDPPVAEQVGDAGRDGRHPAAPPVRRHPEAEEPPDHLDLPDLLRQRVERRPQRREQGLLLRPEGRPPGPRRQPGQFALHPDQPGPVGLAGLLQVVGQDQPRGVVLRVAERRPQEHLEVRGRVACPLPLGPQLGVVEQVQQQGQGVLARGLPARTGALADEVFIVVLAGQDPDPVLRDPPLADGAPAAAVGLPLDRPEGALSEHPPGVRDRPLVRGQRQDAGCGPDGVRLWVRHDVVRVRDNWGSCLGSVGQAFLPAGLVEGRHACLPHQDHTETFRNWGCRPPSALSH